MGSFRQTETRSVSTLRYTSARGVYEFRTRARAGTYMSSFSSHLSSLKRYKDFVRSV